MDIFKHIIYKKAAYIDLQWLHICCLIKYLAIPSKMAAKYRPITIFKIKAGKSQH